MFQISILGFFRYIPRSGITGSQGSSTFSFLRNSHTAFQSGRTSLHSHNSAGGFPSLLILASACLFMMIAFLTAMRCYLIVVLICISLMTSDIEHLFLCLLATCMSSSSLKMCPFRSSAHFLIELFGVLLVFSCMSSLYILGISPLSYVSLVNNSFHSVGCLFILLMVFLAV